MSEPLAAPVLPMPADDVHTALGKFTPSEWRALNRKGDAHWVLHAEAAIIAIVWADEMHSEQETAEKMKRAYRAHDALVAAVKELHSELSAFTLGRHTYQPIHDRAKAALKLAEAD